MRKLKSLIAVAAVLALPLVATGSVSATDSSCTISNTGPGSNNTCTVKEDYTCTVSSDNKIVIKDENDQVAGSGTATNSGNTTGGNATSGSASNENGTTFDVSINNEGACVVTNVTTPVTPTPTQPVGGLGGAGGAGAVAGAVVAEAAKPTVLAKTSGENIVAIVAATVAALGFATAGVRGYTSLQSRK